MKRFAFILATLLLFAACTKEEPQSQPQPQPPAAVSLAGTSWVGGFDGDFQSYPLTFTWRFDFLTDSTGEYHLDCVFAANQQPTQDGTFRYTFDGTDGTVLPDGHNPLPFVYRVSDSCAMKFKSYDLTWVISADTDSLKVISASGGSESWRIVQLSENTLVYVVDKPFESHIGSGILTYTYTYRRR